MNVELSNQGLTDGRRGEEPSMKNEKNNQPTPAAIRPPAIDEALRLRAVEAAYLRELRAS